MPPRKIIITGSSCTGKTTLGQSMSRKFDIPQIDLDDIHFLPNWISKSSEAFISDVQAATSGKDEWIVSGSYQTKLKDNLWRQANIIIWLDLPLRTILGRYFRRTYRRVVYKEKCCGENYETLGHVLFKDNMLLHIFRTYWVKKKRLTLWRSQVFREKIWIVPQTKKDVKQLFAAPCLIRDGKP